MVSGERGVRVGSEWVERTSSGDAVARSVEFDEVRTEAGSEETSSRCDAMLL